MILSPMQGHELAYIIGDVSKIARATGKEYIVFRCPLSDEYRWGEFSEDDTDTFDPFNDILIRC